MSLYLNVILLHYMLQLKLKLDRSFYAFRSQKTHWCDVLCLIMILESQTTYIKITNNSKLLVKAKSVNIHLNAVIYLVLFTALPAPPELPNRIL